MRVDNKAIPSLFNIDLHHINSISRLVTELHKNITNKLISKLYYCFFWGGGGNSDKFGSSQTCITH